jgi:hypothetical protein
VVGFSFRSGTRRRRKLPTTVERRKQHRIKVRWPLVLITDQGVIQGETRNICADGLFMCSEEPLLLNETFHIQISPPDYQSTDLTGRAIWSDLYAFDDRSTVYGTGICFIRISDRDRHLLNEILSAHSPDTRS